MWNHSLPQLDTPVYAQTSAGLIYGYLTANLKWRFLGGEVDHTLRDKWFQAPDESRVPTNWDQNVAGRSLPPESVPTRVILKDSARGPQTVVRLRNAWLTFDGWVRPINQLDFWWIER